MVDFIVKYKIEL